MADRPVRRFRCYLIDRIWSGKTNPGRVLDLELPLSQADEDYRAMDERRALESCSVR